ncbi:Spx/MgsR family RNA polymerase-binding regulatory protein [Planomicrobium sp. YIM 101495]|uniref:Spx/MgsR family RNA polymerase-binding regulatory protein n=1 Tax=Planomicrobium sp. YIM 101495 TaxID=2665160 RepID=UPI0012B9796C|nr:Spx/MgsR family RNA polymerase-binding regulatory protein [Planomicrobium sp. YIM 101495]MTD29645.1 Spx/MgsR family RNA polymerase-binding regulatory protein [Planomicrobium sp. YIM 101495]
MKKLYTSTSSSSCRKAMAWLDAYDIPYVEKNISNSPITVEEIQDILSLTNDGTEEILSTKASARKNLNIDLEAVSLNQFYEIVQSNPAILRLPIIHDDKRLQVGYNDDEIRQFLPRWLRASEYKKLLNLGGI